MLLPFEQLIGLPVETKTGRFLGKVESLVFEVESQSIYQYQVKPAGITHLFDSRLLIHRNQVISITQEKLVVDDAAYQEASLEREAQKKSPVATTAPAEPIARKN